MSLIPICGEQAGAVAVPPLLPAGAARGLCKNHDVLGDEAREFQFQPQPAVNVAEDQRLDRDRAKGYREGGQKSVSRSMRFRELLILQNAVA
jgi:hypothetical protein